MKTITMTFAALAAAAAMVPASASAATLLFELSGGRNLSFQLDSNPTPDSSQSFLGEQAVFNGVDGTRGGGDVTFATISFGTGVFADLSITGGGLDFTQYSGGGPLFTGPGSAPVFAPGTYQLTNTFFPAQNSTLTISTVSGAVPEPATWALFILGFGAVGAGMRRRAHVAYA